MSSNSFIGIRIFSSSPFFCCSEALLLSAIFSCFAACSVAMELMMHDSRIITTTPSSTALLISGVPSVLIRLFPTITIARAPAAWASLSPKSMSPSWLLSFRIFRLQKAAIHFDKVPATTMTTTTKTGSVLSKRGLMLTSMPTPMRKKGMKMAFPTNSTRFISGPLCGT